MLLRGGRTLPGRQYGQEIITHRVTRRRACFNEVVEESGDRVPKLRTTPKSLWTSVHVPPQKVLQLKNCVSVI